MSVYSASAAPGYQSQGTPDLNALSSRERLSQSAADGFFAIVDRWQLPMEAAGELLGGIPRSTLYKLKTASGTLKQDELTRISYVVGIFKALHVLLPEEMADQWMRRPNDHPLFVGRPPIEYAMHEGIPGLQKIRSLVDGAREGR